MQKYLGSWQGKSSPPTAPKPSKSKLKVIDGGKNG